MYIRVSFFRLLVLTISTLTEMRQIADLLFVLMIQHCHWTMLKSPTKAETILFPFGTMGKSIGNLYQLILLETLLLTETIMETAHSAM